MWTPSAPVWIGQVDLDRSMALRSASRARRPDDGQARILVRLHSQVVGFVDVTLTHGEIGTEALSSAIRIQLAEPLAHHLAMDGLSWTEAMAEDAPGCSRTCGRPDPVGPLEPISVVVCTRNRTARLETSLKLLQQLSYEQFEVVVVDNAPSDSATSDSFQRVADGDIRFRYVREPVPGLSRARNRGLTESRARYVAFTDDDAEVDSCWLDRIGAGFAQDPAVGCVTGLVPPAELENAAQHYFDRRFSWSRNIHPHVYSLAALRGMSSLFPYSAGIFGTGANFAVDRVLFQGLGGFDEALGAGSLAGGGEELDAFVRILQAGRSLAYEPSAIVWHHHRRDSAELRRQLFRYGTGLTAFLTKYLCDRRTTSEVLMRVPAGVCQIARMWSPAAIGTCAPLTFVFAEIAGMAAGPVAYGRGRRRQQALPVSG